MEAELKKTLKAVTLELRHLLEGRYDQGGQWKPGDLEQRLAAIGVRRDRASIPVDELGHLAEEDRQARKVVDAYLKLRDEAGVERSEAVAEFVRETAYTWANRLLTLRCIEARELIDSVILQQDAYGGRSLEHHRLAQRHPELCVGDDDGLFAVLDKVFRAQAGRLPMLFDPQAPGIALRPSTAALKDCFGLLSLNPDTLRNYRIRLTEDESASSGAKPPNPFTAPDALGWAYQYWNSEEKNRVFETVRTVTGAKIAGADIIPATQLYTEDYMVKFLVQNSLGATWMGMHAESKLAEKWEYYVKDADRALVERKPVREITFLDPACGSGHFHLEAFDLFYEMYLEEGELTAPEEICNAILTKNLFGIDIDPRAVQIAEATLWMKAAERAFDYKGVPTNLVAATSSHLKGEVWEEFLTGFEREPSVARVLRSFARTMEHIDEIGSLARPAEDLREIIKEEHATWERQVSEKKEANYLFSEMNEAVVSGQLPFQAISDEEFGDRLFYRAKAGIDTFTERARATGEFEDQMLGSETRAGFRLLDLLSRRYDVVAANPPYMGSKNMGPMLKKYVERHFKVGKRDLYAAFVLRNLELTRLAGRVAMVTQQSWMFLGSLQELRKTILRDHAIEALSQHGRYAFSEITNAVVQPVLCVMRIGHSTGDRSFTAFRLASPRSSEDQATFLRDAIAGTVAGFSHHVRQQQFLDIPGATLCYWLRPNLMSLLRSEQKLGVFTTVRKGLDTADNARFVRFHWEVTTRSTRWHLFPKGGGYKRWIGYNWCLVDWQFSGSRIKVLGRGTPRNEQFYGRSGLTYTEFGQGCLGARVLPSGAIFSTSSPGVFADDEAQRELVHAVLNCRLTSFYMRVLQANVQHLGEGYVPLVPLPLRASELQFPEVNLSVALSESLVASEPVEYECDPRTLCSHGTNRETLLKECATAAKLHTSEYHAESRVLNAYALSEEDLQSVFAETGTPIAMFPLIRGYDSAELRPAAVTESLRGEMQFQTDGSPVAVEIEKLRALRNCLKTSFEAGPGTKAEEEDYAGDDDSDEDEPVTVGTRLPIPPETFLEELSQRLEIHPISVYWLLYEGVEKQGWRCLPEERRLWGNRISVSVVRLLGHRWPKQIEAGEPVPNWADPEGIIPLTPLANETTLFERVQERLKADGIDARDFIDVMGKPLDAWLANDFCRHHTRQFKKRPIAWQMQSDKSTAKKPPAFACLLYSQMLDADALPKLRSQYVGPLRQRLETELRGITAIAADARSDRQVKRRGELEDAILELQKFDTVLEGVARTGFGPQSFLSTLRQYAFDDAMLVLKVRWLRRLTELIAKSPLPDWLSAADRTELHPDFRVWIADVMAHLDYFCARVGPRAPDQAKLASDPTTTDLAKLIAPHTKEMLKNTLELACDKWYAQFDEIVLGPDKDKIKTLRGEQKTCEEQLKAEVSPSAVEVRDLKYRVKEIKEDVKILTAKIKRRAALANTVRTKIESWQSQEPAGWGDWMAGQPLFDRIASLDGRRTAPTTIAEFITQESLYAPDINDGVRVNIAPLQKAGVLAADVLAVKELDKAIADRAEWRADERRWVREGKLPQPGWWPENG